MPDIKPIKKEDHGMDVLKLKYGGDSHSIDANTYINSLIHFTTIVQEVNKEIDIDKKVDVRIQANRPGSFVVDLVVVTQDIAGQLRSMFTAENVKYATTVINAVTGVYKIAQFLKGKKANAVVTNKDGTVIIHSNHGTININTAASSEVYMNSSVVREAIAKEFETLDADKNVESFQLLDTNETPLVDIPKEEFYNISDPEEEIVEINERVLPVEANLNIITQDWELKKKWDFYYNGNRISAKMKDPGFQKLLDSGEPFRKGDSLEVDMEIRQEYVVAADAYVNRSYTITKIRKHTIRSTQSKLDI